MVSGVIIPSPRNSLTIIIDKDTSSASQRIVGRPAEANDEVAFVDDIFYFPNVLLELVALNEFQSGTLTTTFDEVVGDVGMAKRQDTGELLRHWPLGKEAPTVNAIRDNCCLIAQALQVLPYFWGDGDVGIGIG